VGSRQALERAAAALDQIGEICAAARAMSNPDALTDPEKLETRCAEPSGDPALLLMGYASALESEGKTAVGAKHEDGEPAASGVLHEIVHQGTAEHEVGAPAGSMRSPIDSVRLSLR
jgi:hypothetical protein